MRRRSTPLVVLPIEKDISIPRHVPGQYVEIPLIALPKYLEIHGLQAVTLGEVRDAEERTNRRKPPSAAWVKKECDE